MNASFAACLLLASALLAAEPALVERDCPTSATVFQYAVEIPNGEGKPPCNVYLWIPPASERVRGIVIGGSILFEGAFASHPAIRAACASHDLAIVYMAPHPAAVFDPAKDGERLTTALAGLAAVSNHPEIAAAPWLPYGHSVATLWTRNVLFWKPDRCFGAIFFKGGFGIPEGHALTEVLGIPLIHIQGRFEEFGPAGPLRNGKDGTPVEDRSTGGKAAMTQLSQMRREHADFLMSLFVEDGSTHFALNERVARILADYIGAAADLRLPPTTGDALVRVDPARGALSAAGDLFTPPAAPAAPAASYIGDPKATFWHGNPALASEADAFHAVALGKAPQFVSAANPKGEPIAVGTDLRLKLNAPFISADEVRVTGAFWSQVPTKYPTVEGPIGHAADAPSVRVFSGSLERTGPDTFRLGMDARWGRPFVVVYHPGDATYRRAEQPVNIRSAPGGKGAQAQVIDFPAIGTIAASAMPLSLTATSDKGLKVRFHVDHGPARVEDGRLVLADVPRKARWPLTVVVAAWQFGSGIAPQIASAGPIMQTVTITGP